MKTKLILLTLLIPVIFLFGCKSNPKHVQAFYDAQEKTIRPTFTISGAIRADGSQEPVKMEFGTMEIYNPVEVEQFTEDDRAVRGIEAGVKGILGTAAILEVGKFARQGPTIVSPEVITVPAEE